MRMNPNYNTTITIYNCLRAADNPDSMTDVWHKTVFHHCFYKNIIKRSEYVTSNPRMDSTYTVRIPALVPAPKTYVPYRVWAALSAEERTQYFTCSQKDIIIKGECIEDITCTSPNTASQLLARCKPEAFIVTAFSDNSHAGLCKHYRIGG